MRRNITIFLLSIPVLVLLLWVGLINYKIHNAPLVKVVVTGYDPRSLISGHYLNLRPLWEKTDCAQCEPSNFDYTYRFYLSEFEAKYLDRLISRRNDLHMELEFALPVNSSPVIRELYIEDLPWKQWVKQNPAKE